MQQSIPADDEIILAIDQGTFSSRAWLFDSAGNTLASAQHPIRLNRIDQRQVEQDPDELLRSVQSVIQRLLDENGAGGKRISRAGLATQRSSIVAWRPSSGKAISPVLSWQDTRAADWLACFAEHAEFIQQRTGLRLSAHYGVSKIDWLLRSSPQITRAIADGDCVITPLASFILFNIADSRQITVDIANAARTLLCNLLAQDWDERLLELFTIDQSVLPTVRPVCFDYGKLRNTQIDIAAVNGDQTAALYSNGTPLADTLRVNLGTGAFVLCPASPDQLQSDDYRNSQLLSGISSNGQGSPQFYIEGTVNGAGAALEWLNKRYKTAGLADEDAGYAPPHCIFINAVGGMGSPLWRSDIEPQFIDQQGHACAVDYRQGLGAVCESIVFLLQLNIERIRRVIPGVEKIAISGGLSNNDAINQLLADLSGLSVERYRDTEATARGIAWLASQHHSRWQSSPRDTVYQPQVNDGLNARFVGFKAYLKKQYSIDAL